MENTSFQDMMGWDSIDPQQYMREMRESSTWGGAIEIKAFVNIFRVNVVVHIPHHQRTVEFVYDDVQKQSFPFVNILWTGNHFVPVKAPIQNHETSVAIRIPTTHERV